MTTKFTSPRHSAVKFKDREYEEKPVKGISYSQDRGRFSTQESEDETLTINSPRPGAQGEFSGFFDKEGHHLKSDGTPDMRFKENREEFEGQGYEKSPSRYGRRTQSTPRGKIQEYERRQPSSNFASRKKETTKRNKTLFEHKKSDGTPDMRFKENRDQYSGKGIEVRTGRSSGDFGSKTNLGLYEGNLPGEHSGKYDEKGHHLKQDGTPDMRFKENRDEFSGKGYEQERDETGNSVKSPRYKKDRDQAQFTNKIYYRRRRPPTPYAQYIREQASEMKRKNPDIDMNEVFRRLGEKWHTLSLKEKNKYYDMYDKEVQRFEYSSQFPHKGPLTMRKAAEHRGIHLKIQYDDKKSRSGNKRNVLEEREEQDEYEENQNPNEAITA